MNPSPIGDAVKDYQWRRAALKGGANKPTSLRFSYTSKKGRAGPFSTLSYTRACWCLPQKKKKKKKRCDRKRALWTQIEPSSTPREPLHFAKNVNLIKNSPIFPLFEKAGQNFGPKKQTRSVKKFKCIFAPKMPKIWDFCPRFRQKSPRLARNPIFKTADAKAVDQKCDQKLYKSHEDIPHVWKMPHTPLPLRDPKSKIAAKKDSF